MTTERLPRFQRTSLQALQPWIVVFIGFLLLYVPSLYRLLTGIWATEQQGHGPIVLGLAIWLIWRQRDKFATERLSPRPGLGWPFLVVGALIYVVGRSQGILTLEVGSLLPLVVGTVLVMAGKRQLVDIWFALFFMLFMIPLPGAVVDAMTQPMKLAVSYVAEHVLFAAGYPISRTGVTLDIGQYQLLVADACAGLHTLFTLEAMGLLYLNVVRTGSAFRNIALGILIIPISFTANVIRVMALILITYYFGDEAGQGFLHGFAGMVLFLAALMLIMSVDGLLRVGVSRWSTSHAV